ncbi:MAG TPA: hypothetical protein VJO52_01530 [Gemmatimonadaceae bacterium]|nr:hypothetical protein [Gemmatimonadaceae bacterium]
MPEIRFVVTIDSVRRRPRPHTLGRMLSWMSNAGCHGPVQPLRAATAPIWLSRQSRTEEDVLARTRRIALATAVSAVCAGSKMNARSLCAPSPLMSDATSGVKGAGATHIGDVGQVGVHAGATHQIQEAVERVGVDAQPLQHGRIHVEQRRQLVVAPPSLHRSEDEQLVLDDGGRPPPPA